MSRPSPKTDAVISTNQIFARVSIHTWLSCALIYIYLAGLSFPLWGAHTVKAILQINTGPTLSARTGHTLIQIVGTGRAVPAWRTLALKPCEHLVACSPVGARIGHTGVLDDLAGFARVALWTSAEEFIWLCVHTGSSVHTRLVATAVVQIFIAEEASPVPLTIALPGIAAGPMNTTRIKHTIVTELALPAIPTHAFSWDGAGAM